MKCSGENAEKRAALAVADLMAAAAKTAPKGCGVDNVEVVILDGAEKDALAEYLREIGNERNIEFFVRDAGNINNSHCVVLIGVRNVPLALAPCGLCGFKNCGEMKKAGGHCAFNITDLGIAVGSAVSVAADHRIDNRVMYSAGVAAVESGCFSEKVRVAYAIPLSTSSKSIFFDRNPGAVLV